MQQGKFICTVLMSACSFARLWVCILLNNVWTNWWIFMKPSANVLILWHDAWKLQSPHLLGGASLSTFLWQHGRRQCWTANCCNSFPQQQIRLKKLCIAYRVTSIPRQRIQKRFRSHGNEPPKHSNSEERDNSTAEGGDLHTVRPEPTSGRVTHRRRNKRVTRVEAGSNTSTVTLRAVGGDEKGSLKSETVNMVVSPKGLGPENDCAG
jgi:hypothetical protein